FRERVCDPNPKFPRRRSVAVHRRLDVAGGAQNAPALLQDLMTCWCWCQWPPFAIDEGSAQCVFEPLETPRHGRLGQEQLTAGTADGTCVDDRNERANVVKFHENILIMRIMHLQHRKRLTIVDAFRATGVPRLPPRWYRSRAFSIAARICDRGSVATAG